MIGRHDAVFLFVVYTLFALSFSFVDTVATKYVFAVNFWSLLYALYVFGKLMDNKKIGKLWYLSSVSVLVFAAVYTYTLQFHENPWPKRTFPLYSPFNATLIEGNSTESNSTMVSNEQGGNDL